jgi:hypothetical protein
MKNTLLVIVVLLVVGCSSTAPVGKFKDYFIGPIKIRFHEEKLPENRKRDPWTGYGVDGGFPQTVVSSLEITDASGTYSLPADMVDDLGNPNIGCVRVRQNEKLLELSMTNSDGAGGHHVLFQVDLEKARACRFVRVVIEDDFTKTHDWTKIKNHRETKRKIKWNRHEPKEPPTKGVNKNALTKEESAKLNQLETMLRTFWVLKPDEVLNQERLGSITRVILRAENTKEREFNLSSKHLYLLELIPNIKELNLRYNPSLKDISALKQLTTIRKLSLPGSVSDLSPLNALKKLESLEIQNSKITNLDALEGLTNLHTLFIPGNRELSDITGLKRLGNLETLWLSESKVGDLSPLKDLKKIKVLRVNSTKVSDLSPIKNLKNVEELDFGHTEVNDVSFIKDFKNLKSLTMWQTKVNDISLLNKLKNLESLNISNDILDKGHVLNALKDINVRVMVPLRTNGRTARAMYWKERKE